MDNKLFLTQKLINVPISINSSSGFFTFMYILKLLSRFGLVESLKKKI